nr:MAG TPA: tail tube protein [Bacteriophage sp.]
MTAQAKDVLTGTDVQVWLDGDEVGVWASLEANVTMNYEDVNIGQDVDRKFLSFQGDGSLNYQATNSMTVEMFNKIKNNPDVRFTIEGELTRRSTGGKEAYSIPGVTFDSIPLATWSKNEVVTKEMSFRFPPSQIVTTSTID